MFNRPPAHEIPDSPPHPRAPGCRRHFHHTAKLNRPRFLLSQSWVCLAAVLEGGGRSGAVPLMLRLLRATGQRSKRAAGLLLLRLLGGRLGAVCLLLDAWYMRARLIRAALARGHCVIGRVRKDLALYLEPPRPPPGRRGRPRTYGDRVTPERVARLPVHRSAGILYGRFQVIRYRTCCVAARFLKGDLVRAVWVELERDDRPGGHTETRLLLYTDPLVPALEVIFRYSRRWSIEPLFFALKHGWGLKDAWQRSRQGLMRWATLVSVGYALVQILTFTDPAHLAGVAQPARSLPESSAPASTAFCGRSASSASSAQVSKNTLHLPCRAAPAPPTPGESRRNAPWHRSAPSPEALTDSRLKLRRDYKLQLLLIFVALQELVRALGPGKVRALFFGSRTTPEVRGNA